VLVRKAAERHRQAEHLKEAFRDAVDLDVLRRAVLAQQRQVGLLHTGRAHDRRRRPVQPRDLAVREQARRHAAVGQRRADVVQVLGLRVGQRLQQHGVERAEDRGRGADAECERRDGGERKRGCAAVAS
jgi:hypothetical protein